MCLHPLKTINFLWWTFPKVQHAKEDITVYKVLDYDGYSKYIFYKYRSGLNFPQEKDSLKIYKRENNGLVGKGWLHCYKECFAAKRVAIWGAESVAKMVIPKGTKYILGTDHEICAKCLKW